MSHGFCRKDSIVGGHFPESILDVFQLTPICSPIFLKSSYFGSLLPALSVYKIYLPVLQSSVTASHLNENKQFKNNNF